jgi:hypothetical protein
MELSLSHAAVDNGRECNAISNKIKAEARFRCAVLRASTKVVSFKSRISRLSHGLRNSFAFAPAERFSNPAVAKTNKKGPARGLFKLVAGVGFEPTTFRL